MMTDRELIALASGYAAASRDPSTKTGCVVLDADSRPIAVGINAFPMGVEVTDERLNDRPTKLAFTVHAEMNALIAAKGDLTGCTVYLHPWPPCAPCAAAMIQAGVERVVAPEPTPEQNERWGESFTHMKTMFNEAGVQLDLISKED